MATVSFYILSRQRILSAFSFNLFHVEQSITYQKVSRETFADLDRFIEPHRKELETYVEQLFWWNERINLVSRDVSRETLWEHIRHSLLVSSLDCYKESKIIVDAGTGGGLPGLPLALISPGKSFILNDIVSKKIIAVKQMARKLGVKNITTNDRSITELDLNEPFLLVTKHAFKINDLFRMVADKPWSHIIFYKGLDFEDELQGLTNKVRIRAFKLFADQTLPFYKGKALVEVVRNNS